MRIELLASALRAKGARVAGHGPGAAALLDAGGEQSLNPKLWPCEDSLALLQVEGGILALVADSHWGGAASEHAARDLAAAWERSSSASRLEQRLVKTLLLLEARFLAKRPAGDRSETTVLIAHLGPEGALSWVNVGDSYLWRLAPPAASQAAHLQTPQSQGPQLRTPQLLNARNGYFLGNTPLAACTAWTAGGATLRPGEALLLASDGLESNVSGLEPEEFAPLLALGPPGSPAGLSALADRAVDPARGGGRDNLALISLAGPLPSPGTSHLPA